MLGSGINPESFKQDYSGFARAAETQAQGITNLGASIGGVIKDFGDEKKKINQDIAKGKSALQFAKANYPELAGRIDEIGKIFSDVNVSKADQAAAGSQMGEFVTAMIRGQEFNTEIGLKKRALEIQEAQNIEELAAKDREIEAKSNQRIADSIFIGGRDVAVTKDGFGNIYDPKTDKLILDQGIYQAGGEDYGLPTNQSNQDTGDLLQKSLELNDPAFGSQQGIDTLFFPDGVAPQENPMPAGTPTTTVVPKVDGVPTPRGTPRTTASEKTGEVMTQEQVSKLIAQGFKVSGSPSGDGGIFVTDIQSLAPQKGQETIFNDDGTVTIRDISVGGKKLSDDLIEKNKNDFTGYVQQMSDSYARLDKMGKAVTGASSNPLNYIESTSAGQELSRMFGSEPQVLRDQINTMRPSIINVIRQASEMGAKGLDSEKELAFYLSALGDPKLPVEANIKALEVLDKVYGTGKAVSSMLKNYPELAKKVNVYSLKAPDTGRVQLLPDEQQLIDKYKTK